MKSYDGLPGQRLGDAVLAIGSFDGIHLGHQAVLECARQDAQRLHAALAVLTFEPHPRCIVDPANCPPALTTREEKLELLAAQGVDFGIVLSFTPRVARQSAPEFLAELGESMRIRRLVCGLDFAFGHKRQGNVEWLREHGLEVTVVPPRSVDGAELHSSDIRKLLAAGEIQAAAERLGRPYSVRGTVEHGAQIGRAFGYPTANLAIQLNKLVPKTGVYAVRVSGAGEARGGAVNIGFRPTFGGDRLSVEVYVLDFEGDLYGKQLEMGFVARLRDELKFDSAEELAEQIGRDVEETRTILAQQ